MRVLQQVGFKMVAKMTIYVHAFLYIGNSDYGSLDMHDFIISAGETTFTFNVSITDDSTLEGNENFTLDIIPESLPNGVSRGSPGTTTIFIMDNDSELLVWLYYVPLLAITMLLCGRFD